MGGGTPIRIRVRVRAPGRVEGCSHAVIGVESSAPRRRAECLEDRRVTELLERLPHVPVPAAPPAPDDRGRWEVHSAGENGTARRECLVEGLWQPVSKAAPNTATRYSRTAP